jgi:hypothetical protein
VLGPKVKLGAWSTASVSQGQSEYDIGFFVPPIIGGLARLMQFAAPENKKKAHPGWGASLLP